MQHSPQYIRKRKFLLMLPVLIVPFITLAFWALGGGKGDNNKKVITESGLDLELPGANVKNEPKDKLAFYDKAESDSEKFRSMIKDDPYFKKQLTALEDTFPAKYTDPNEAKVYSKLNQLNAAMNNVKINDNKKENYLPPENNREAERLEKMIQTMQQGSGTNPEMDQVNGMLEKILDIQHPDRVKEKMQSPEHQQSVFSVSLNDDSLSNQFYSLEDTSSNDANAIPAVIHETQTIVSGSTVKLRLLSEINIAGRLVPKDNFVYGIASLNGERLNITVKDIRYNNSILPVALSAYDLDGMEGVYIPGAISRDVAKQSTDNSLQQIGLNSPDPSIGMQAANAGIQAAKTILSKKIKLVKVTVKAGYKILLKDK
jgi:conjugative transposon TraM protein